MKCREILLNVDHMDSEAVIVNVLDFVYYMYQVPIPGPNTNHSTGFQLKSLEKYIYYNNEYLDLGLSIGSRKVCDDRSWLFRI